MPTTSINIIPQNGNSSVVAINCGTSSPKLGGTINVSAFTNLTSFTCIGNDITAIDGYTNNNNLKVLSFSNNKVTGRLPSLSACTSLNVFNCNYNPLTGSIPSLTSNINLEEFQCGDNDLTGSLPALSSLTSLSIFHCWANTLTGPVPTFPSSITSVSIHTNLLSESIPSLSSCINLGLFHAHGNQLTGSIPNLTLNTNLVDFRCQNNRLSGSIPVLSACSQLTIFLCDTQQGVTKITGFDGGSVSNTLGTFQAHNNQLTSDAVNAILAAFVAAGRTTGARVLNLGGTGNSAPTGQGLTDKDILISRGWTVTTN